MPGTALELIDRARHGLREAVDTADQDDRYVLAHLSALRSAAAVLAVRGRPTRRGSGRLNVWVVLPKIAPELGEWAAYFAAGAARRQAIEAGRSGVVSTRDADDLVRAATDFLDVVSTELGVLPIR
ncbi:MAG: hypothetical protein CSB46_06235 [Micrococcales bacterium]|nr:MAG: hypothetical protein CSB46_06235 [Micrococcales bacterium]